MRLEQRHPGVERRLDLRKFDLSLRLDLKMDRIVLRPLLIELSPVRSGGRAAPSPAPSRVPGREAAPAAWAAGAAIVWSAD
jgi:hypothetical protein